jgi:hypothetical protein
MELHSRESPTGNRVRAAENLTQFLSSPTEQRPADRCCLLLGRIRLRFCQHHLCNVLLAHAPVHGSRLCSEVLIIVWLILVKKIFADLTTQLKWNMKGSHDGV